MLRMRINYNNYTPCYTIVKINNIIIVLLLIINEIKIKKTIE